MIKVPEGMDYFCKTDIMFPISQFCGWNRREESKTCR